MRKSFFDKFIGETKNINLRCNNLEKDVVAIPENINSSIEIKKN
jgi:hypothetical protein